MQKYLLTIAVIFLFSACGSDDSKKNSDPKKGDSTFHSSGPNSLSREKGGFYRRMEGSIDGKPVVVNISRFSDILRVNYYYTDEGKPVFLYQNTESPTTGDTLELIEYNRREKTSEDGDVKWLLAFTEKGAKGRIVSKDGKKSVDINLKENYPGGSYLFAAVGNRDSFLIPRSIDTLKALSTVMMLEPSDAALAGNWFKAPLLNEVWDDHDESTGLTMSQLVEKDSKDFIVDYKADIDTMRQSGFLTDSTRAFSMNYENMLFANLLYNDNGFAVMDVGRYYYSGGAHGMETTAMICYDMLQRKDMELSDILSLDSLSLQKLLEAGFREQNKLKPNAALTTILFENKLPPNNNFYFTNKGIGFIYQPYEVAAYVYGAVEVFLPFTRLKGHLNPQFAQRLNLL